MLELDLATYDGTYDGDDEQAEAVLRAVVALPAYQRLAKPLGVRLPPYFDLPAMEACAALLNKFPTAISRVVCCHDSVGAGLTVDTDAEMPATNPAKRLGAAGGGGHGGGAIVGESEVDEEPGRGTEGAHDHVRERVEEGALIRAVALANVKELRQLLKPEIEIVGSGGVTSGAHAFSLMLCGATAVAVRSDEAVDRITTELRQICKVGV